MIECGYPCDGAGVLTHNIATDMLDWEHDRALEFLDSVCPPNDPNHPTEAATCAAPFMLFYNSLAPHEMREGLSVPAQYANLYDGYSYTGRGYNERLAPRGLADKPFHIRYEASTNQLVDAELQARLQAQLESLRWLDDNLADVVGTIEQKGILDETIIIFASDNGYLWGEHGHIKKSKPYEEVIRGPLFIRHPDYANLGSAWRPRDVTSLVSIDLDLAPTVLHLAGVNPDTIHTDGRSLKTLVEQGVGARDALLIQGSHDMAQVFLPQAWVGIRTADGLKYVEYITGEREFYDLEGRFCDWDARLPGGDPDPDSDPYEENSQHAPNRFDPPSCAATQALLALQLDSEEHPDRLLAIVTSNFSDYGANPRLNKLPNATVGRPYPPFQFETWGEQGELTWSLYDGLEPCAGGNQGLDEAFDLSADGRLTGAPSVAATHSFCVTVTSGDTGQADYRMFELRVLPAGQ